MLLITHGKMDTAIAVWIGIADIFTLTRTVRLALLNSPAFHVGRPALILSTKGNNSFLVNLLVETGIPKYLQGKACKRPGKQLTRVTVTWRPHWIGDIAHLSMLV